MTSEAFVYLMLPSTTQFVTAGRIVLTSDPLGVKRGRFVYGRRYLERADAVPIDPIELKLDAQTYETVRPSLTRVFASRSRSPRSRGFAANSAELLCGAIKVVP